MKALLVMAHGSPRPEANEDVRRVTDLLREGGAYPIVSLAFLDCNEPDIPSGIDACVAAGATAIDAVPYFLHSGRHFLIDLPEILVAGEARHPGLVIRMGDYVGHEPQVVDVLFERIEAAKREQTTG